jgi:hypothetical protein
MAARNHPVYIVYVEQNGAWHWHCEVEAESHAEGLRMVGALLGPEHDHHPVRVERWPAEVAPRDNGGGRRTP